MNRKTVSGRDRRQEGIDALFRPRETEAGLTRAVIELPIPPSVNGIWRAVRKCRGSKIAIARSKEYSLWLEEAVLILRTQAPKAASYPVWVKITVIGGNGWRNNRDLDNIAKPILDALKHAQRIEDDTTAHVNRIDLRFIEGTQAACMVEICGGGS